MGEGEAGDVKEFLEEIKIVLKLVQEYSVLKRKSASDALEIAKVGLVGDGVVAV